MLKIPPLPFYKCQIFSQESHWGYLKPKLTNKQKIRRFKLEEREKKVFKNRNSSVITGLSGIAVLQILIWFNSVRLLSFWELFPQINGSVCFMIKEQSGHFGVWSKRWDRTAIPQMKTCCTGVHAAQTLQGLRANDFGIWETGTEKGEAAEDKS